MFEQSFMGKETVSVQRQREVEFGEGRVDFGDNVVDLLRQQLLFGGRLVFNRGSFK